MYNEFVKNAERMTRHLLDLFQSTSWHFRKEVQQPQQREQQMEG
jgi:hypothetical protein